MGTSRNVMAARAMVVTPVAPASLMSWRSVFVMAAASQGEVCVSITSG
jgi:3,4-dihydroxy-2-butanone 4-phosphate synthase